MSEIYRIDAANGKISLFPASIELPGAVTGRKGSRDECGIELFCRMGDPDVLEAIVWRHGKQPGGIFTISARDRICFFAVAETGLAFAVALGHFGKLCANARYGIDIFEELGEDDE